MRKSCKYPPRRAFVARASSEGVGEITALDRPRFVEAVELGVPRTRGHSLRRPPASRVGQEPLVLPPAAVPRFPNGLLLLGVGACVGVGMALLTFTLMGGW
ncbi:MAG TPA: hypothetical protein ENK57_01955 [Polyangiaceae bacterium]|nr:hypothetical protein [Polyangiaceae bacterium]